MPGFGHIFALVGRIGSKQAYDAHKLYFWQAAYALIVI